MSHIEVDVIGLVLYAMFFVLVGFRVRPFFNSGQSASPLSSTDRLKLAFHICLMSSALLELGAYHCMPLFDVPYMAKGCSGCKWR